MDLTWTEPTSIRQERLKPEVPEAASAAGHLRLSLNYGQDLPEGLLAQLPQFQVKNEISEQETQEIG